MAEHDKTPDLNLPASLPVLPLRDVVVYPNMVIPLFVGRDRSIRALESAMTAGKSVLLVAQKNAGVDDPGANDIYRIGTVASILQLLKLPDGTVKVLVEGVRRAQISELELVDAFFLAHLAPMEAPHEDEKELEVAGRSVVAQFEQYIKLNKKIPPEVLASLHGIDDPNRLADTVAAHLNIKLEDKQVLLETAPIRERFEKLLGYMEGELELLEIEKRVRGRVKKQMEKSQREYYLNEQMKAIQKEMGELDGNEGGASNELEELEQKIQNAGMTDEAKEKAMAEFNKLKMMSPMSAEATVVRNYLDWLVKVPWQARSRVRKDLARADAVLDEDHFGLEKVMERIVEYLAVQQRVRSLKGPILCLVGPPGVGKTSIARSIARATNRKFVRMSLGGVRDEAEIRGHRRTYIGSMPGKIVQNMSKVGVRNPLYLLDEIDKMAMDFRGDPSSALLEVLDPEQNHNFNDHYLEVDYDLSDVMFVATANSMNIPGPLLDRMEVIRIAGYTEQEKVAIAKRYLLPKQMQANGLKAAEVAIADGVLHDIIRYYTREAGVRNLEREIAKILRKVVREILLVGKKKSAKPGVKAGSATGNKVAPKASKVPGKIKVTSANLERYLGVHRFRYGLAEAEDRIGQVTGLAWTEVGGDLLSIEAAIMPGKGKFTITGQLGDVMKESIQAALSVVRSRAEALGIEPDFHEKQDIHVHVPEGAIPKDGPSAGVGMVTTLVSVLTSIPVRSTVAMTGEITLRGEVLPIGGLKEKLLAAHRGGIETVIIPEENRKDLKEVPANVLSELDIHPVRWIDQVLDLALSRPARPLEKAADEIGTAEPVKGRGRAGARRVQAH